MLDWAIHFRANHLDSPVARLAIHQVLIDWRVTDCKLGLRCPSCLTVVALGRLLFKVGDLLFEHVGLWIRLLSLNQRRHLQSKIIVIKL